MRANSELLNETIDKSFGMESPFLAQHCSSATANISSLATTAVGF